MKVLSGKAIQQEHAQIVNILLTTVTYGPLAFLVSLSATRLVLIVD